MGMAKFKVQMINEIDQIRSSVRSQLSVVRLPSEFHSGHWLRRAYNRGLLSEAEVTSLRELIEELTPKLSAYISSIGKKPLSEEKP
jgi:tRNA C32,U32 (ribose-2'-O)-methylase TrmJ